MLGHSTTVVFHADAEAPVGWDCSVCPAEAKHAELAGSNEKGRPAVRVGKTHWEQVQSRRTEEELETLLDEALTNYRKHGAAS
jgi:hypothetical protein